MSQITRRDVEGFAKVLVHLGRLLQEHPEKLVELLDESAPSEPSPAAQTQGERKPSAGEDPYPELTNLPLFESAKGKTREELLEQFRKYDMDQLRHIVRHFRLGSIKTKSQQTLLDHLVDQLAKRSVDVFLEHK
jgi:hypothetical protein